MTRAPIALRFDFVPISFTLSQWSSPLQIVAQQRWRLVQIDDQDVDVAVVIEIAERAAAAGVRLSTIPGPLLSTNSSNVPLPKLRKITRGLLSGYCGNLFSTSG